MYSRGDAGRYAELKKVKKKLLQMVIICYNTNDLLLQYLKRAKEAVRNEAY